MKRHIIRRRPFSLIEAVAGIALLGLVTTAVYSGLHLNARMQDHFLREQHALQTLDNALERIQAHPRAGASAIKMIVKDEFDRSAARSGGVAPPDVTVEAHACHVVIRDRHAHQLAAIRIPIR